MVKQGKEYFERYNAGSVRRRRVGGGAGSWASPAALRDLEKRVQRLESGGQGGSGLFGSPSPTTSFVPPSTPATTQHIPTTQSASEVSELSSIFATWMAVVENQRLQVLRDGREQVEDWKNMLLSREARLLEKVGEVREIMWRWYTKQIIAL